MTEEQTMAYRRFARQAGIALAAHIIENLDELVFLGEVRASSQGVKVYGDTSYHKEIEHLEVEVDEEIADAIFYQHIIELLRYRAVQAAK